MDCIPDSLSSYNGWMQSSDRFQPAFEPTDPQADRWA
jgi:hypothetical protein